METRHPSTIIQIAPRRRESGPAPRPTPKSPANDRFERDYDPSPWDNDGVTAALERDARDYELIAIVGGALVLLLGIVALVVL